jgi:hypothetical protein
MPTSYQKLDDGGVVFTCTGMMGGEETMATNRAIYADPAHADGIRYQIVDLLGVDKFTLTAEEMRELADQDTEAHAKNPGMIIAIVMTDKLAYGMTRVYSSHFRGDGKAVKLFTDLEEAKSWIRSRIPDAHP